MGRILDGRKRAEEIEEDLKRVVLQLKVSGVVPTLEVILVGEDPAARAYVKMQKQACERVGIRSKVHELAADISQEELLGLIARLNEEPEVHGILVQLPLPAQIEQNDVLWAIAPEKDVDCFNPDNMGGVVTGDFRFAPSTPLGIMKLLEMEGIEVRGLDVVIIGHSNIVGKPMALLLLNKNATVTVCHIDTKDIKGFTRSADMVVVAVGKPNLITEDMIKEGAIVIDVGINKVEGDIVGDVDFAAVKKRAGAITPVPGGVGPMTIATLLTNTVKAAGGHV
ncbi:MAG: bifunctional 5,10-methylenetetrahydrofolate dehydrogenase/5,10-methenyltetrahydrofolate cyclohydrolase [Halanaerobium sp.]|nr:bifunctional 5,10-methylenetetrahydrofolate dehydrogenase/5,10-methenyltetrahydrofolate cyclohydrolase [Halanaerobium sp.]